MFKRLAALTAATGVALSALSFVAPAAQAADQYAATGVLVSTTPGDDAIALCAVECVNGGNLPTTPAAGVHRAFTDGATGEFTAFPEVGTYRVAVKYSTSGYSATGYLASASSGYKIVSDFAAATPFSIAGDTNLGRLTVEAPVSPGGDTPVPDASTSYKFSGAISWLNERPGTPSVPGFTVALCETSCTDGAGNIITEKTGRSGYWAQASASAGNTSFAIPQAPASSSYKVAVSFDYNPAMHTGYLARKANGNYRLVSFAEADSITLLGDSATTSTVEFSYTAPVVEPEAPKAQAQVMPTMLTRSGVYSGFRFDVSKAGAGSDVTIAFRGCGGATVASKTDTRDGNRSIYMTPTPRSLGSNWTIRVTVKEPGKDARTEGWDTFGGKAGQFSCAKATPSNWVKKWSAKRGAAKVGKKVTVSRTVLSTAGKKARAAVKYSWYLNGKKVSSKVAVKLPKNAKGKTLTAKISVAKKGYTARTKTVNFGRVR